METDRSFKALLSFLDYMADKGLAPKNTVFARKAAVTKVLGILSDVESADVLSVDLPHTMARFSNLKGKGYTPASLTTYQSRVKSALEDFSSYLKNPLAFRPSGQARERGPKPSPSSNSEQSRPKPAPMRDLSESTRAAPISDTILPIAIRADLTIYIQGLPFNLSKAEASKIAAVVMAMSGD
jgi:hypothetical protein